MNKHQQFHLINSSQLPYNRAISPNQRVNLNGKIFNLKNEENTKFYGQQINSRQNMTKFPKGQFKNSLPDYNNDLFNCKTKSNDQNSFLNGQYLNKIKYVDKNKTQIQKAYQQLKIRQLQYLSIIKDLYLQNQMLKKTKQLFQKENRQMLLHKRQDILSFSSNQIPFLKQTDKIQLFYQTTNVKQQNNYDKHFSIYNKDQQLTTFKRQNVNKQQKQDMFDYKNGIEQSHVVKHISNIQLELQKQQSKIIMNQFWKQVQSKKQNLQLKQQRNAKKQVTFVDSLYNCNYYSSKLYTNTQISICQSTKYKQI